jgi:hypothetical protein
MVARGGNKSGARRAEAAATAKRTRENADEELRQQELEIDTDQENVNNVNSDRQQQQQRPRFVAARTTRHDHPATVSTPGNPAQMSDISAASTTVTYAKTAKGAASFFGDHGVGYNAAISRKIIDDLARGALFKKKKFINSEQELNDFGRNSMGVFMAATLHIKQSTAREWWLLHKQIVARAISIKRNNCNSDMKVVIISKLKENQSRE